jgi:REP element-mobilizing transposase RayT
MVLALVFDAETPFSTIRTQASQLVHSLSNTRSDELPDEDLTDGERKQNSLSDSHTNNPAPNSLTDLPRGSGYDYGQAAPGSRKQSGPATPFPFAASPQFSRKSSPGVRLKLLVDTDQTETPPAPLEETVQSQAVSRKNKTHYTDSDSETIQETHPRTMPEVGRKIVLEPVSPAVYNLDYACLLVPRFPHHHMTGDLLDRLGEWVPQICIAFGLRLEYISVRPEYLQWIVNVPPATSPAYLMRVLRQHTSENIFAEFPRFKKDNPSGDFWAPGYLIMGGSQPPPAQLIKDFIAQTRQRQGFSPQFTN